jgi:hypothetical protein
MAFRLSTGPKFWGFERALPTNAHGCRRPFDRDGIAALDQGTTRMKSLLGATRLAVIRTAVVPQSRGEAMNHFKFRGGAR